MKGMPFDDTYTQIALREQTVTRRLGWRSLRSGDQLCATHNGARLALLRVVEVGLEPLRMMAEDLRYGRAECRRSGYAALSPEQFVADFCSRYSCRADSIVTRIEFEYLY